MTALDDEPLLPVAVAPVPRRRRLRPRHRLRGYRPLLVAAGMVVAGASVMAAVLIPHRSAAPATTTVAVPAPPAAPTVDVAEPAATPTATGSHSIALLADSGWVAEQSRQLGIPPRALASYSGAAIKLREEQPGCGLGWNTLAGIGWVESEHGTLHGGHIAGNGATKPPIYGVPLSGQHDTEQLADTDGGAFDGDAEWDRAMGPLQFVPDTWAQWGADGNGDGVSDPQQLDDAALAAARYLCHVGGDLTVPENWIAAVSAYNSPVEYVNRVADAANAYGQN